MTEAIVQDETERPTTAKPWCTHDQRSHGARPSTGLSTPWSVPVGDLWARAGVLEATEATIGAGRSFAATFGGVTGGPAATTLAGVDAESLSDPRVTAQ